MKKCGDCHINVATDRLTCPLCFKTLVGESLEENLYPKRIIKKGKSNLFYKIVLYSCFISSIITFIINYLTYTTTWWCIYVIASVSYFYVLVRVAILSHGYVIKKLCFQLIASSIVIVIIDYLSSSISWSMAYVVPSLAVFTNITIGILVLVNQSDYSKGFNGMMLSLVFGIVPTIFQAFNAINIPNLWAPMVSSCVSLSIFLGLLVFGYKETIEEFKKRFHL